MSVASSSSTNMYDHQAHIVEVSELKASLENANQKIEEQRLRKNERDRQMTNHARQMEEMKKMLEEMSRSQRGP